MKHAAYTLLLFALAQAISMAQTTALRVYLFPGQGSDQRIFAGLHPGPSFTLVPVIYPIPQKNDNMQSYAQKIVAQIDTSGPYAFVGVSLGGMLCSELAATLHPQKVIIISSAKTRNELPFRYRFQKHLPLYKLFPPSLIKLGARLLQPVVEPDRRKQKAVFKSMLKSKNKRYLKRTIGLIVNWQRTEAVSSIRHIHGSRDHTIPHRCVNATYTVKKGSHMMTLTRADEINALVSQLLSDKE